ncbi:hypothetical protein [Neorhizobium sp. DAR64862/K0K3]|uniref:Nmad2 family putative nucleotide modification protein n=1 Tax=Neorhizobium sp. DAR64862/K0K3 TaxID=3421957 RepID=UPI003D281EB9
MSRIYSYVVEHDLGFAPNPFWGICTLANCKPIIRKHASAGDLIIGTGSADLQASDRLVYWMRIEEIVAFDGYWSEPRFARKKPNMNGSLMHRYGDNIYHTGDDGTFQQLDSFHSEDDGSLSVANRMRDTGTTEKVLLATDFAYFGKSAAYIPEHMQFLIKKGPGHKCRFSDEQRDKIEAWLATLPERGYLGEPGHW